MHLRQLRSAMHDFCEEAAWQLAADTHEGHELSCEVVESGRRDAPLYCYRPLTGDFIRERSGVLTRLPAYLPAAHALIAAGRLDDYLEARGAPAYAAGRDRADAALHCFLARVFEDSSDFAFHEDRFDLAFREYEAVVADGRTETIVVAVIHGVELTSETGDVPIGEGLSLLRGDVCLDAPDEVRWSRATGLPQTLAVLRGDPAAGDQAPLAHARVLLRRLLVGLRLYDAAGVVFAPVAWTRTDNHPWQPLPLAASSPADGAVVIAPEQEDELRAFLSLIARRTPRSGEVAWALRRYELALERGLPAEALTDLLLALRALLEPEGPASGLLPVRLAALCAEEHDRARLAERVAHAASLERAIVAGLPVDPQLALLVEELAANLQALLRDLLCGHLDANVRGLADSILGRGAQAAPPNSAPAPPDPGRLEQDTFF
jgi:hypothetical protein